MESYGPDRYALARGNTESFLATCFWRTCERGGYAVQRCAEDLQTESSQSLPSASIHPVSDRYSRCWNRHATKRINPSVKSLIADGGLGMA